MFRIAVGGQKGGSGKSTTVANLAVGFARQGFKVAIRDRDPQGSISLWCIARQADKALVPIRYLTYSAPLDEGADDTEIEIVDMLGADIKDNRSWIMLSDAWLVPLKPTQMDLNTVMHVERMLAQLREERPIIFSVFLNEAPTTNSIEKREALEWLKSSFGGELCRTVIHARKAYRDSISDGKGVMDGEPGSLVKVVRKLPALVEFTNLFYELTQKYTAENSFYRLISGNKRQNMENISHGS